MSFNINMNTVRVTMSKRGVRVATAIGALGLVILLSVLLTAEENQDQQSYETHMKILATRRYPPMLRANTCNKCNDFNFTPIIRPRGVCGGDGPIDMLVFITTIPKAVKARRALRETWVKHTKGNTANVRHLFLFGGGWNKTDQEILNNESLAYGDILQDDYKDAYYNLSLKMISGYEWALKYCPRAEFTLRTADDNYINVPLTLEWVKTFGPENMRAQIGHIFWKMKVHRYPNKKWYVSHGEFPEKYYPPYAVGTAFLYSMAAVKEVVQAAPNVPFFSIEDAWFGMVMREIRMPVKEVLGFDRLLLGRDLRRLEAGQCPNQGNFFGLHLVSPESMRKLWDQCPSSALEPVLKDTS